MSVVPVLFFFSDPASTEIYTLSLHDALPISLAPGVRVEGAPLRVRGRPAPLRPALRHRRRPEGRRGRRGPAADRKSTRLNSSHSQISYAVFCLKKKNK